MDIRERLNKNQRLAVPAAIAMVLVPVVLIVWHAASPSNVAAAATKAFYSDDDGATWFVDEAVKIVPFDHGGKPAVRAEVFRCRSGKPFVGYLKRYGAAEIAKVTAASPANPAAQAVMSRAPMQVKKPGDAAWFAVSIADPSSNKRFVQITTPSCPEGGTQGLSLVSPADPHNGATR